MRKIAIAASILLCFLPRQAFGCWPTDHPPVVLKTNSLNVRVTDNEAPRGQMTFELHQAITFARSEARRQGAYEKKIMKSVVTDSAGMLSFGEVKPGRYWVVLRGGGSLSDSVAVEIVAPNADISHQRLWVKYYGDGCRDDVAENME